MRVDLLLFHVCATAVVLSSTSSAFVLEQQRKRITTGNDGNTIIMRTLYPHESTTADAAREEADTTSYCSGPHYSFREMQQQCQDNNKSSSISGDQELSSGSAQEGSQFVVVQKFALPSRFNLTAIRELLGDEKMTRLQIDSQNVTLPVALWCCCTGGGLYPSLSRARKAVRQGNIVYLNNTKQCHGGGGVLSVAQMGDWVQPGMQLGRRLGLEVWQKSSSGKVVVANKTKPPSFHLPVIFEDDHMAVVNKPSGVLVYPQGGEGRNNVRLALLHVLQQPSSSSSTKALDRPEVVHRLDFATSGLLVVAKTAPAVRHLSQQFEHRKAQKTYTAIVDGLPHLSSLSQNNTKLLVIEDDKAQEWGVLINKTRAAANDTTPWRLLQTIQDGKEAVTIWRPVSVHPAPQAKSGYATMVELRPKTGRYHQLRRHMAWTYDTPIAGDQLYHRHHGSSIRENQQPTKKKVRRGLLLCSNRITIEHPYYNTPEGRTEWNKLNRRRIDDRLFLEEEKDLVYLTVSIELPEKFDKFLQSQQRQMTAEASEK